MTTFRVPRRVTEVKIGPVSSIEPRATLPADPVPLADWRTSAAFVLLGEPGSGKTTAFEMECEADRGSNRTVSARDFTELEVGSHPEWRGKTLFIDGLDEIRMASSNWRRPLDRIRKRLDELGHPPFRLSCRAGEWLGEDDAAALGRLGSYQELVVLRLEPLDEEEIRILLEESVGQSRASEFMNAAQEHDLFGLLQHPLHLELLLEADIVKSGIATRRGLFESACRAMIREKNPAHRAARRGTPHPTETALLNASGRLSALSLLTDTPGWSVDPAEPIRGYPALREIEDADSCVAPEELDGALRTRLFGMTPAGRFEPLHRQVAEFLGGRFLGRQVDSGNISCARMRALLAGGDGAPAPSLRGLAAWIAVHSRKARPSLIRDDPVGVASYGDSSEFPLQDQRQLVSNLRERAREIDIWQWPPAALTSLATAGALPIVRELISAPERDNATQSLAYLAMRAIAHTDGSCIPRDLRAPLLDVVHDPRWWPGTRAAALKAWVGNSSHGGHHIEEAPGLLEDIRNRRIEDPRGSLTGILLGHLYPTHTAPEAIWDFARPAPPNPIGSGHQEFWLYELPRLSEEEGLLAEVLDTLCQWLDGRPGGIGDYTTRDGVAKMFARALERHGDDIEIERLYAWLRVALPWMRNKSDLERLRMIRHRFGVGAPEEDLRANTNAWLRERPSTQRALMLEIVRRQDDDDIIVPAEPVSPTGSLTLNDVLADAPVGDFAPWFLEQAVSLSQSRPRLACHMLGRTGIGTRTLAQLLDERRMPWEQKADRDTSPEAPAEPDGLTLDEVRARISGNPPLEECLESLLAPVPRGNPRHPLVLKRERKRKEWIEWVREQADALGCGQGPPAVYHDVARAYLGVNTSVRGDTPEARLRDLFLGDRELSQVALDGLRQVNRRTDLPTLDDLIDLEANGRVSYFILPLLAALDEEERTVTEGGARLAGDALQRALAAFFFARGYETAEPAWYRRALGSDPEDVAEAFVTVYRSRAGQSSGVDSHLRALTGAGSHAEVARMALPRLLKSFPAKATAHQVFQLDHLIPAALERLDRDELASIVHRKLELSSLRVGHRVRWLATGMLLGDSLLAEQLNRFLADGRDGRVREFAAFLKVREVAQRVGSLPDRSLAMIVSSLGGYFAPASGGVSGYMSQEADEALQADGLVRTALEALSWFPSPEATQLIESLLDDEDLAAWREPVAEALDAQRVVRLDAEFEPPTIRDVVSVLKGGRPAGAADLAALVGDGILAVGEQVRDGDADLWRHFWSEGKHGKPETPKIEPSCELALLAALRPQLPERVRVDSEARHAGGRRADLQVSFGDFAVPVETKMSSSRDLWTGVTDQLIPRYTRDPRSDGYGIYVVFWHGPDHAKSPTPKGRPARTPDELQNRLTQQLPAEAQRKVSVIVLDVSPPSRGHDIM